MKPKPLIVILGGGYGGIRVALDLAKTRLVDIVVVDKNLYHVLPSQFFELGSLFKKENRPASREEFRELFHSSAVPYDDIFENFPAIEYVEDIVEAVEPDRELVVLKSGREIQYQWLVVALGSQTNYFNIPHLERNAIGFKNVEEVFNIRDRIDELFYSSPKNKKITILVGGGGVTGCEFSSELVGYMKKLSRIHARPVGAWECVLVEASPTILGTSSPWIQQKARARLRKLGVTVLTESPIVDVWPGRIYITQARTPFSFDLLIWTAGVKGACEGEIIRGVPLQKKNCLIVGLALEVVPYSNVFTIGDIAASMDPRTGASIPMTAQKAIHEGAYVAGVIRSRIKNPKRTIMPYRPKMSSYIIPLGGKYALLETPRVHLSGFPIWILKYVVLLRYLLTILPPAKAFRQVFRELALYTRND